MGTPTQNQGRPTQGDAGQKTAPRDPKLNPERDDDNRIEQRTSDEGQGREDQSSEQRIAQGGDLEDDDSRSADQTGNAGNRTPKQGDRDSKR